MPYSSGKKTPGGISPVLLGAGLGVGAFTVFGLAGIWYYHVYSYPYTNKWTFHNATTNTTETKPVNCLCQEYSVCGCEDNENLQFQKDILGNGSYEALNKSVVSVADIQGKSTIILNGTLPNGTTAAGGTDDGTGTSGGASDTTGTAFSFRHSVVQSGIYWIMAAMVGSAVFFA